MQSRYYDPVTHRFINADSLASTGQGILGYNMFSYCLNNPTNFADASGQIAVLTVMIADGGGSPIRDVTAEVDVALSQAAADAEALRFNVNHMPLRLTSEILLYKYFYDQVNHEAPWDIKRQEPWKKTIGTTYPGHNAQVKYRGMVMNLDKLGNFTYGYLGAAYGIPIELLIGFYYAADFPTSGAELGDEIKDWGYITLGYLAYLERHAP